MLTNYLLKMTVTTDNWLISEYCTLKAPTKFTFILRLLKNEFTIGINPSLISFFPPSQANLKLSLHLSQTQNL